MAVTRIKNNQITDSTVNAAQKLTDYTVTSAKIANNLTYNSDLTVTGNLTDLNKNSITSFSCTTEQNGKCYVTLTAPTNYGDYILEIDNYKNILADEIRQKDILNNLMNIPGINNILINVKVI